MRSKCSNRRRGLSTNYSSCSARCAARAGHTHTHTYIHTRVPPFSLRVWIEVHERVQRRRFQRVQRLFHSFREPREYHVLNSQSPSSCPVCHDRPSWTRFRVHGVANGPRMEREREREREREGRSNQVKRKDECRMELRPRGGGTRTTREKTEGDGRLCCTTCVQVASFRFASLRESSQGALVCSSFRVVSSFASSGARVQAGQATATLSYLASTVHLYSPYCQHVEFRRN